MKFNTRKRLLTLAVCSTLACPPVLAAGDDIDIFTGASAGASDNPRILIVLDNTSNWSRNSQHWKPKGTVQAQAEARSIKAAIASMGSDVDVGLMEFVTSSNDSAGFVRFAMQPLTDDAKIALSAQLDLIYANYATDAEKTSQNVGYGGLMYDVYNYLSGAPTSAPSSAVNASIADSAGYTSPYSRFKSPVSAAKVCGKTYMIFLGNAAATGPKADDASNTTSLREVTGSTTQMPLSRMSKSTQATGSAIVGTTSACYGSADAAGSALTSEFNTACKTTEYSQGCAIGAPVAALSCPVGQNQYQVVGTYKYDIFTPSGGTYNLPNVNADEWVRFMHRNGTPVSGTDIKPSVTTYTVDVYKNGGSADHTALLTNMALAGGGKYFRASNEDEIMNALEEIMSEIQAVNSAFASTSLPVNATNRSQNENQVFIGMFRPDAKRAPRWFGNLKRYQLIQSGANVELGDVNGKLAVNTGTGFLTACAQSFWTSDSDAYWDIAALAGAAAGTCLPESSFYSDAPDGPLVEKGAVAQVLRQGNIVGAAADNRTLNRNMKTMNSADTAFIDFTTTNVASTKVSADVLNFIRGADIMMEKSTDKTKTRPSIHGDVIHSRPLPVNYGADNGGVTIYYGANDGTLRAVSADTGVEHWSFVAPEFYSRLERLKTNLPIVSYFGESAAAAETSTRKDYFFDGSTGLYQNADNSKVWIYPSMRRGGRMIYAINASSPTAPVFKWKRGCPNLTDNAGCDSGFENIGQTWSTPTPAFIKGFSAAAGSIEATPALIFGGGYDGCEDSQKVIEEECAGSKGKAVYILNGDTGAQLASFTTSRAVAADVSMVDIDNDGYVDYAYAADVGGSLYRIDFITYVAGVATPLAKELWTMRKVANTSAYGRKFLFAPALLYTSGKVYVAIGTGDREHPLELQYPYSTPVKNRFYVYKDDLATLDGTVDLDDPTIVADYSTASTCETPRVTPSSDLKGWSMDLHQFGRGEQTVTSALIAGGMVTLSTNRPNPAVEGTCTTALGIASGYWLNLFNGSGAIGVDATCGGSRNAEFVGGGLPPSPVLATSVPITLADGSIKYSSAVFGAVQKDGLGASSQIESQQMKPTISKRRKRAYTRTSVD